MVPPLSHLSEKVASRAYNEKDISPKVSIHPIVKIWKIDHRANQE